MKKRLKGYFALCSVFGLSVLLTSCFLWNQPVQKFIIYLLSDPYAGVVIRVNGTNHTTNTQVSQEKNAAVTLSTGSTQYLDRSAHIAGNDTRLTFVRWSTGTIATSTSFTVTNNASYTAIFNVDFWVTAQIGSSSERIELPISAYQASGTTLEIRAPEVANRTFLRWMVNGANLGSANPLSIVVNEPKTIRAVYDDNPLPPTAFSTVSPTNGATQVANTPSIQFLWTASTDPQGGAIRYDLYLGEEGASPTTIAENVNETYWITSSLAASKTYRWFVVARNNEGMEARTEEAMFTTVIFPPSGFAAIFPENAQIDVPYRVTLIWDCLGASEYDLYFGDTATPVLREEKLTSKQYRLPDILDVGKTYYWKIVGRNQIGETAGGLWQFSVSNEAIPPAAPQNPSPVNDAINEDLDPILSWSPPATGTCPIYYDVYFGKAPGQGGTSRQMAMIRTGYEATSTRLEEVNLLPNTMYIWQVVAKNPWGVTTGPVWSFTTKEGAPLPTPPKNPIPADGAIEVPLTQLLRWDASMNGAVVYDVYFGESPEPMTKIASGATTPVATPPVLLADTDYYWKVAAKNEVGVKLGAVWSFRTEPEDPSGVSYLINYSQPQGFIYRREYDLTLWNLPIGVDSVGLRVASTTDGDQISLTGSDIDATDAEGFKRRGLVQMMANWNPASGTGVTAVFVDLKNSDEVISTIRIDVPGTKSSFAATLYPMPFTIPELFTVIHANIAAAWKGQSYDLGNEVDTFEFEAFNGLTPVEIAISGLGTPTCDSGYVKSGRGLVELVADPDATITRAVIKAKDSEGTVIGTKTLEF
ncbi:MAG TPA: hypothetical protein PLO55_12330 [Thermotogota bacterium]|nr:hypothetical protein [Thermotogota bacterium]